MSDIRMFEEPVEVALPKYQAISRVLGVEYRRNPNAIHSGRKFAYAIAEWQMRGSTKWVEVRDLVTLMRLANHVEHPCSKNIDDYATAW